jgi:hypothetical protein
MRFWRRRQHSLYYGIAPLRCFIIAILIVLLGLAHWRIQSMPAADNEDPRFQEHMKWLGHVAAISASLDLSVNMAIWELANVERWIGACLTTQIFSPSSRFRVLISLVHVRGGKPEIISKIRKFAESAGSLSRRAVDETTGDIKRIHVTMEGAFSFGFTPTSVDELKRLYDDIQDGIRRFDLLHEEIFGSLRPWPRTQFSQSRGIRSYPLDGSSGQKEPQPPPQLSEE